MPAKAQQKRAKTRTAPGEQALSDPRFSKIQTDAVYRLPSRNQTHVSLDSRFAHMLHDESFNSKAKVDRYGRAVSKPKSSQNLERLYRVGNRGAKSKKSTESPQNKESVSQGAKEAADESDGEDEEDEEGEDDAGGVSLTLDEETDEEEDEDVASLGQKYDPARSGGFAESSTEESDSDDSELEEEDDEADLDIQQDEDVPEGEVSSRLAVVNLDWDNIRAVDLMAVLRSFAPAGEKLKKVTVYPSEFGKERLEREEIEGPPKELFQRKNKKPRTDDFGGFSDDEGEDESVQSDMSIDEEDEDERIRKSLVQEDQGEDFDPVQLRRYQLERLRYYYAVVECSSEKCALSVYKSVDGTEYLSTANFFDLRFVPDDTDFSEDRPRDSCTDVPKDYAPNEFSTDALQNSKVKLTWDADDVNRKEAQKKAFSRAEIDENDLKAYLASDTSDDEADEPEVVDATNGTVDDGEDTNMEPALSKEESKRQKMRALLGLNDSKSAKRRKDEPVGDMQITFTSALGGADEQVSDGGSDKEESTLQKYTRKERERKARRKEQQQISRGDVDAADNAVSEAQDDLGFDDPFFTEPVNDQKAAKAARKEEKRKKRAEREAEEARNSVQKADLERIMGEGSNGNDAGIQHFDLDELKKAEKAANRKGKKSKLRASEKAALEARAKDNFEMDVDDPRFKGVFENPAQALDPNDARFSKTAGMQKLLEASRKKRAREMDADDDPLLPEKRKKASQTAGAGPDDLNRLVQRVKGKKNKGLRE